MCSIAQNCDKGNFDGFPLDTQNYIHQIFYWTYRNLSPSKFYRSIKDKCDMYSYYTRMLASDVLSSIFKIVFLYLQCMHVVLVSPSYNEIKIVKGLI